MNLKNVSGRFLIAAPGLEDPNFSRTVVLVCEHSREGAFGLIINRVLMDSFLPLLNAFEIEKSVIDMPVYFGGPVRPEQGYVLFSPTDDQYVSLKVNDTIAVTASKEILSDIAEGKGPKHFLFTLGFSGWAANQLDEELSMDGWIVAPLDFDIIFQVAVSERWRVAADSVGIDFDRFISRSGSA